MKLTIKTSTGGERTHSGLAPDRVADQLKITKGESRGRFVVGAPPSFYNSQFIVSVDLPYEGEARIDYSVMVEANSARITSLLASNGPFGSRRYTRCGNGRAFEVPAPPSQRTPLWLRGNRLARA